MLTANGISQHSTQLSTHRHLSGFARANDMYYPQIELEVIYYLWFNSLPSFPRNLRYISCCRSILGEQTFESSSLYCELPFQGGRWVRRVSYSYFSTRISITSKSITGTFYEEWQASMSSCGVLLDYESLIDCLYLSSTADIPVRRTGLERSWVITK